MKKNISVSCACLLVLLVLFATTDPTRVPSFVLILPFLLLFAMLVSALALLFQNRGMPSRRSWKISALCAAVPMSLLVLQSIGQLTARDLLTIAALFMLSYFYILRVTASS